MAASSALQYARQHRYSLLLEGAFASPEAALGVTHRFAEDGYTTHLVVVAVRPDESMLARTSTSLHRIRRRQPAQLITVREHAATVEGTCALVTTAAEDAKFHRVSVIGRSGDIIFDHTRRPDETVFADAASAFERARAERMTTLESTQWLSELRRITEFAQRLPSMPAPTRDTLIELHTMAAQRVIPELPVPPGPKPR